MVCTTDDVILCHGLCVLDDWRSNDVDNVPMMSSDWLQELYPFSSSSRLFSPITSHLHNQSTSCATADNELCREILNCPDHVLRPLLLPLYCLMQKYNFRSRPHGAQWTKPRSQISCNRFQLHDLRVIRYRRMRSVIFLVNICVTISILISLSNPLAIMVGIALSDQCKLNSGLTTFSK